MGGSNENLPGVTRPSYIQGGVGNFNSGIGNNRRVLSTIDSNVMTAPHYHFDVYKKGGFTEENAAPTKNSIPLAHRSVTRKFGAQLAGKPQPSLLKIVEPSVYSFSSLHHEDYFTNTEDYTPLDDHHVPMFIQHTEAMLEEIDRMDVEVEMAGIDEEEPVVDIDSCDGKNLLAVTEYVDDLYAHYRNIESASCVPANYMAQQSDINERMRGILIDWLIEVHCKLELMDETLYLTVNLIDRFLAVQPVVRKKLQLVGVTAMLLACKYEEVSVPAVKDLLLISGKAYSREEVFDMEKLIINTLHFNLSVPTLYVFVQRFLKAAQSDKQVELLSFFIVELCLVEYDMLRFPPSLLAAAAVFTAQCTLNGYKKWSKTCKKHTQYNEDELRECAKLMVSLHEEAGLGKLLSVYKKYSSSKYGYAAKTHPVVFM